VGVRGISILPLLLLGASTGFSATVFNFSGTFTTDDFVQGFVYNVQNTGVVDVFTTSFATGGFAPILSVFDDAGNLQFFNDGATTNDCLNNGTDPATGSCWDARLSWNSLAGTQYLITLTQDDNFPLGPTLQDGFLEQGNGNFTAQPPFNLPVPGGAFLLAGGVQRTGDWAVSIQSADPTLTASAIPEPSTIGLFLAGAGLLVLRRRTTKQN
jgi:PEP-CTERM motif